MAGDNTGRPRKMSSDDVISFVCEHEDPAVKTAEVAEEFDMSRRGTYARLSDLHEQGRVEKKIVGSAAVWFVRS